MIFSGQLPTTVTQHHRSRSVMPHYEDHGLINVIKFPLLMRLTLKNEPAGMNRDPPSSGMQPSLLQLCFLLQRVKMFAVKVFMTLNPTVGPNIDEFYQMMLMSRSGDSGSCVNDFDATVKFFCHNSIFEHLCINVNYTCNYFASLFEKKVKAIGIMSMVLTLYMHC